MTELNPECSRIRDEFSAFLDDELSTEERDRIEEHLSDCAECLRALNRFKRVDDAYAGLARVSAPAGFDEAVREALQPQRVRPFPVRAVTGTLIAAAAAVLLVVTIWPRTVVAPDDGAMQLSKAMEEPAPEQSPAAEPARELEQETAPGRADEDSAPSGTAVTLGDTAPEGNRFDDAQQEPAESATTFEISANEALENRASGELESIGEASDVAASPPPTPQPEPAAEAGPPPGQVAGEDRETEQFRQRDALEEQALRPERPTAGASAQDELEPADLRKSEGLESTRRLGERRVAQRVEALEPVTDPSKEQMKDAPSVTSEIDAIAAPEEVKAEANTQAPQRTFEIRDGVWYETGYVGQDVREVSRDSAKLRELMAADPRVAELVENQSRVVFAVDEIWYALPAVR